MESAKLIPVVGLTVGCLAWLVALIFPPALFVVYWIALAGLMIWTAGASTSLTAYAGCFLPVFGGLGISPEAGMISLVMVSLPTAIVGFTLRRNQGMGWGMLAAAIPPGVAGAVFYNLTPDFYELFGTGMQDYMGVFIQQGLIPADTNLERITELTLLFFPVTMLTGLLSFMVAAAFIAGTILNLGKVRLIRFPAMAEWTLSELWLGATVLASAALVFAPGPGREMGLNLILFCGLLYATVGFSVLHSLLLASGTGGCIMVVLYGSLFLTQPFSLAPLALLGLMDAAFDLRKRTIKALKPG